MRLLTILFIIALISFIFITLFLIFRNFCKNRYYHGYVDDDLLKDEPDGSANNLIFDVNSDTRKYIKRYIIRKSQYETSVICNYNESYNDIAYYITSFNSKHKPIGIVRVRENRTSTASRIIRVSKKTQYVNIWISEVNNTVLNTSELMPVPVKNLFLYSLFRSIAFFNLEYCFLFLVINYLLKNQARPFFYSFYFLILIGASLLFAIMMLIFGFLKRRKRNWKNKGRSIVSYEFI